MYEVKIDSTIPLERVNDVEFARVDGRPLLLDAAHPVGEPELPRPAVIRVHGGGWATGTRTDEWATPYLATHGFFAASIDYRLSGEAPFPSQLHDVKAAIRFLRRDARRFRIDTERIGIWGGSAGAHLAALAGVTGDSDVSELEGTFGSLGYSSRVQAVVWCCGFADFLRPGGEVRYNQNLVVQLFGGLAGESLAAERDLLRLASPLHHVGPGAPPFLLLHGTSDETTRFEQAVVFYEALVAHGVEAELIPLVWRCHNGTGVVENPDESWRWWEAAPMALPFLVKHLRRWPSSTSGPG